MKNKITGIPRQIQTRYCPKKSWLGVRKDSKSQSCQNCKTLYTQSAGDFVGLMIMTEGPNVHVCEVCAEAFKLIGGEDIDKKLDERNKKLDEKIQQLLELNVTTPLDKLKTYKLDELEALYNFHLECKQKEEELANNILREYVDTPTEQYLIDQYDIEESKEYLKHHSQIEDYCNDNAADWVECGQGFYQDIITKILKIGNKFYEVIVKFEIGSAKQDRGDRLYWIDGVDKVTYKEIPKPVERARLTYNIQLNSITADELSEVQEFLKISNIDFKIYHEE